MDEILNNIIGNAFNGLGDTTGSDEFGASFAWIDLLDFVEDYNGGNRDSDTLSKEFIKYNGGKRYAVAYITADGVKGLLPHETKMGMLIEFSITNDAFLEFIERERENNG